ncbi:MAG: hypothetical protein ACRENX_08580 [Candidatus Dormibacteria bacterium]
MQAQPVATTDAVLVATAGFAAGAECVSQQPPVELRKPSRVGGVQDDLPKLREGVVAFLEHGFLGSSLLVKAQDVHPVN